MTSQQVKSFFASLKNLEGTGLSLESGTQEIAACYGVLHGKVPPLVACKEYARQNDETVVPRTVEQVVTEFLAAKEAGSATRIKGKGKTVSERYLYDLRKKLEKVSAHFNGLLITLVTAEEINRFVSELRGVKGRPTKKGKAAAVPKPISGRTKNNYLQAVNVLLEFAKKQKYVPRISRSWTKWTSPRKRISTLRFSRRRRLPRYWRRCGRMRCRRWRLGRSPVSERPRCAGWTGLRSTWTRG